MKHYLTAGLLGLGLMAISGSASEASIFTSFTSELDVNINNVAGDFGTVTVTDITDGVSVDVTLTNGATFVTTGGGHESFALNLSVGTLASTAFSVTTAGFQVDGAQSPPASGNFTNGLGSTAGTGGSNSVPGPLDFTITGVTTADFIANNLGFFFAADLLTSTTGEVGATSTVITAVPEPSTWAMLILGFAGIGFMAYRRRNSLMLAA